uniref:uncharacterized protein LOC120333653 n=1 Tax=Styela clava TaxID=7725 RepID=UPI00193AD3C3|nr:uncharacterized protein LOC120333653 [Styela clava]
MRQLKPGKSNVPGVSGKRVTRGKAPNSDDARKCYFAVPSSLEIIVPPTNIIGGPRRSSRIRMRPLKPGEYKILGVGGELLGIRRGPDVTMINKSFPTTICIKTQ